MKGDNMTRSPAARAAAVIGGIVLLGIALRLLVAILKPVLPAALMSDLEAGWGMLHGIVAPALPAIIAVGILAAITWAVVGFLRRR
jgi:hypothetical protein